MLLIPPPGCSIDEEGGCCRLFDTPYHVPTQIIITKAPRKIGISMPFLLLCAFLFVVFVFDGDEVDVWSSYSSMVMEISMLLSMYLDECDSSGRWTLALNLSLSMYSTQLILLWKVLVDGALGRCSW